MALSGASTHAITLADLRACLAPTDIFTLFRKLRYPIEALAHVPIEEGSLPGAQRDGVVARYPLATVGGERPGDPRLDVTLFVLRSTEKAEPMALARGIAQTWPRRFPGHHLLIFAIPNAQGEFQRLIFVNPRRLGEGATVRFKLHRLIVERTRPTRHDADTLNRIILPTPASSADTLYRLQCEAFNVERLTDEFYKEYARRFREAMARIAAENRRIAAFYDSAKLHTFTQRLFGRMMFLYFLQKKGALNDEQDFITRRYLDAAQADENFYRETLEPLFFETLNRPRDAGATRFGRVPYLNGGLFAADEDDHVGVVYLDNALFEAQSEDGLLGFLNSYNFTIEEDTPLETQVALDPEMLGKVFENVLEAEERGKSGTFYTPRAVVAFMCREALAAYLSRAVPNLGADRLRWLLDEAETGEAARDDHGDERLTFRHISYDLHEEIERALRSVRALDPAVGSGAFPLGMLALLVGVQRALYRIRENKLEPQSHLVEDWKRAFIRDCLYGVDIRREAIEIARLRLWLSLVVDADPFKMEPLPNLDYKLMDGDSLIETFDGVEIYPTRPDGGIRQETLLGDAERKALIAELKRLQAELFQPRRPEEATQLRLRIRETEAKLLGETLDTRERDERTRLEANLRKQTNLRGAPVPRELQAEQTALTHSIQMTAAAQADVRAGKTLPFFLYRLHFASVFEERGGFDIVIANPPYVSIEHMPTSYKPQLKEAYPAVAAGRADLYTYFYARALQLLRDGGTLCFISSNKFFRAGYGKGLLRLLANESSVRTIIDFGDFPVFDAAAYPCIVIADKGAPAADHKYRGLTAGNDIELDKIALMLERDGQTLPQAYGVQPPSGSAATSALVKRLMAQGQPLGAFTGGKMYRGILTGLNEAFVVDQATRDRLISEDPRSAEVLKPFLRGRDVGRYRITSAGLWLVRVESGWTAAQLDGKRVDERTAWQKFAGMYPSIAAYLAPFADKARKRDDQGQYWWELRPCVYYSAFEGPKIVYSELATEMQCVFDPDAIYIDCTLYCIPLNQPYLVGLLNSSTLDFLLKQLAPAVRGGFHRFKREYMEHLPIVEPSEGDKRRLEALVDELQALGGVGARAEALEREVDAIVYRTYGLAAEEIAEIERWHAERRALLGKGGRAGKGEVEADAAEADAADDEEAEQ